MARKPAVGYEYFDFGIEESKASSGSWIRIEKRRGIRSTTNHDNFWSVSEAPESVWAEADEPESPFKVGEWALYGGGNVVRVSTVEAFRRFYPGQTLPEGCVPVTAQSISGMWAIKKSRLTPHPQGLGPWCEKYYPIKAEDVSKEGAAAHALRKYVGTRAENLERFGLSWSSENELPRIGGVGDEIFTFGSRTCALCVKHFDLNESCPACPLVTGGHGICRRRDSTNHYGVFCKTGNPEPMISALQAVVEAEAKPKVIEPPEDGPWQETHRWDGKPKRVPKNGEPRIHGCGRAIRASADYTWLKYYMLIPLTEAELSERKDKALRERAAKAADDGADASPGTQDVADVMVAFHKQEQARKK